MDLSPTDVLPRSRQPERDSVPTEARARIFTRIQGMKKQGARLADIGGWTQVAAGVGVVLATIGFLIATASNNFLNPTLRIVDVPAPAVALFGAPSGTYQLIPKTDEYLIRLEGAIDHCEAADPQCSVLKNAQLYLRAQRDLFEQQVQGKSLGIEAKQRLKFLDQNEARLGFVLRPKTMWAMEHAAFGAPKSDAARSAEDKPGPHQSVPWLAIFAYGGWTAGLGMVLGFVGRRLQARSKLLQDKARSMLELMG